MPTKAQLEAKIAQLTNDNAKCYLKNIEQRERIVELETQLAEPTDVKLKKALKERDDSEEEMEELSEKVADLEQELQDTKNELDEANISVDEILEAIHNELMLRGYTFEEIREMWNEAERKSGLGILGCMGIKN